MQKAGWKKMASKNRIFVPDYYYDFKCIADKCSHTCCEGWEIDIDDDSLNRYEKFPEICSKIDYNDIPHFILDEKERCPFLQDTGLCEMILKYGEDMLCQTCTDHPRFRNFWEDRIEMGLGLVCEEAIRCVIQCKGVSNFRELNSKNALSLSPDAYLDTSNTLPDDEKWLFEERFNLIRENEHYFEARYGSDLNLSSDFNNGSEIINYFTRLREYFLFRHIPDALYDDRLEERIQFIDYLIDLVYRNWQDSDKTFDSLVECIREISYDYEYDEDRKEQILNKFYIENAELVLLTEDDYEEVVALYKSALGTPGCVWTESYPTKDLLKEDIKTQSLYGLFSNEGTLIAAIAVDRDEEVDKLPCWSENLRPSKELARLVVSTDYRNLGIARNMIKKIMPILKAQGNKSVHYLVCDDNPQAIRSYASLEFNNVGRASMFGEEFTCYEKAL